MPAVRPPSPVARPGDARPVVPPPETSGTPEKPETPAHRWRRLTRTRRGAAGLAILAAALLLWPFAGWFWIPWLAGLVVLVLVALLRLDRLLHGWSWHLGGLAVLVGLMLNTGPWDWALAASLGVLLAGLVQLPWWRLAAVGAVLCLLAGAGWGFDRYRAAQERAAQEAQTQQENMSLLGERSPERVLPGASQLGIGQGDVVGCAASCFASRREIDSCSRRGAGLRRVRCVRFHAAQPHVPRVCATGQPPSARTATC